MTLSRVDQDKGKMDESLNSFLTPPEIAKLLRVSPDKVLAWIRSTKLRAIIVGIGRVLDTEFVGAAWMNF